MKLKNILFLLLALVLSSLSLNAQTRNCSAHDHLLEQLEQEPKRAAKLAAIEKHTKKVINNPVKAVDGIITIPIVFHVVYNTSAQNISDAQIASQLQIINEDFRRTNSDADGTWSQAADTEIEFCMASIDPNGNATTGITRTQTSTTAFGTNDQVKFASSGGVDAWPADSYLNVWVCNISGGILGYAQFPGGSPATDGVVNHYLYTGNIGTATAPFNLGRTLTHEIGHYLNLRHIWGDGGCGVDDFVADTPESDASNGGCATTHSSCGSVDMVQNYMDYSNDACMNLFTQGQKDRMRAIFEPGGSRVSLLSSAACGAPAEPTCTDGIQNGNETGIDCGGDCAAVCPTCTDGIQNGDETGVDCGGSSCNACPCLGTMTTLSITFDNYPEETSWTLTNASGATVASGGTYGSQPDGSTLTETFCLDDGCYDFTINDAYGDGICCQYGNGSYSVTDANGASLVSGSSFTNSETTNFCVGGNEPTPTCTDGIQNGNETGVDCGGDCAACPTCDDGVQNGNETGVDCGGDCNACVSCDDGIQNGNETGVDCGGDCVACPTCDDGIQNGNETGVDCGGDCDACATCTDGIQNGNETGVDCGGDCQPCTSCNDGIQNGNETGVDCGGDCDACASCDDGVQNGDETGVDCGGSCTACATCTDGIQNGNETGVDCGGDCQPCSSGCAETVVTVTVNLDNYPEETTWALYDAAENVVASGGAYGNQPDGSTVVADACLADGCYFFVIEDAYGDGICCGYGNGSYSVTSGNTVYANGGQFGGSEVTDFCIGDAAPTCDDGIQNGNETGVDCGGSCAPCDTGGDCVDAVVDDNDWEASWGIWNDGGSDCRRSSYDAQYANSGNRCVRLRDNTSTSVATTDNLDLSNFELLTVDFNYLGISMENGEDFWLQISTDGGSTYNTIEAYSSNDEFVNGTREFETVDIAGPFSTNTRIRFRCDASGNRDYVYIDDVLVTGCAIGGYQQEVTTELTNDLDNARGIVEDTEEGIFDLQLFPNPATDKLTVTYEVGTATTVQLIITDLNGRLITRQETNVKAGLQTAKLQVNDLNSGIYLLQVISESERMMKKFVVVK